MSELLCTSIAEEIEKQIRDGILVEKQKLPSERSLAEQYGVSRNVVREALKVLNEKGIVKTFTGRGGYVSTPGQEDLIYKLETAIDYSKINVLDIIEAREAIDMAVAKNVINRINEEQVEQLQFIFLEMEKSLEDSHEYAKWDAQFHLELATISNNEVLKLITTALNNVTDRNIFLGNKGSNSVRANAHKEHKAMLLAITERDSKRLNEAISRHIECIRSQVTDK